MVAATRPCRDLAATASLAHYRNGRQAPHAHRLSRLSFLLAGEFQEDIGGREFDLAAPAIGFKREGVRHSDAWGPSGALFFSVTIVDDTLAAALPRALRDGWRPLDDADQLRRLARRCMLGEPEVCDEAIADILALAEGDDGPVARDPPAWLMAMKQAISEPPPGQLIAALAAGADVHRIHALRMFKRHFGVAPSVYRRRCLAARAVASSARSAMALTDVAHDSGFFDQSHAARTVRCETGFTMSELRGLLRRDGRARASSIQAPHSPV